MKFEVRIGGKKRAVELQPEGARWRVTLHGRAAEVDAIAIGPDTFSILLDGQAHEIRISGASDGMLTLHAGEHEFAAEVSDPRAWRRRRHGALEAEGRQQITAPMPGKVVRMLVQTGDKVEAGQGLLVVEAMKMQNEVRSPKRGTVERLLAKEGQPVNAGEVLIVIS